MSRSRLSPHTAAPQLVVLIAAALLVGCVGPGRGPAVPFEQLDAAQVPGFGRAARTWGARINPEFLEELMRSGPRERAALQEAGHTGPLPPANVLAISGGGSSGAFAAGLLNGWTARGDRPQFKAVTGVSTGALIAPFAYLGPDYDHVIHEVYTQVDTDDILTPRVPLAAIFDDALADNAPLWRLVSKYVNQELLDEIAAEYRKGRILSIGTTNLDARRGVIWNIGFIANSGHPQALELVRKILVSSAAIPAAFPPVMIDVEVDGQMYQEMHVDGGCMAQVYLYPPTLKLRETIRPENRNRIRRAYIIRNSRVDPEWAETQRRTLGIAARAVESLIHSQGLGDLFRLYLTTQRDGLEFNVAWIPPTFRVPSREIFDPVYMTALYELGYQEALEGNPWHDQPPYFEDLPTDGLLSSAE